MSRPTGRLFGWLLAVPVIALFCALGNWQLGRAHEKEAMLAQSRRVLAERRPVPLAAAHDPARRAGYEWTAGQGRFLDLPAILLDNQNHAGRAGVRVFRVFQPQASEPLLLELGWLPLPGDRTLPRIPHGASQAQVAGLLAPPPSAGIASDMTAPQADGSLLVTRLDPARIATTLKLPTLAPRVLRLDPADPLGYTRDLDILPNTLPPERHLGYAVQWFGLAVAVFVTALVLTLRRRRQRPSPAHEKMPP